VVKNRKAKRIENTARTIGVLYVLAWLIYIMIRTTGGDVRSLISFIPAGIMLLLMMVANQNQVTGGIVLLITGTALAIRYALNAPDATSQVVNGLLTGGPYIIVGLLYLVSGLQQKLIPGNKR
jgi:hypothetical protein